MLRGEVWGRCMALPVVGFAVDEQNCDREARR